MSRNLYLVSYDVASPARLHRVQKKVAAFAIGGQKSFYECWMTRTELDRLQNELKQLLNVKEDSVYFFQLDPRIQPVFMGTAIRQSLQPFLIV